jgi:hypothetical protein
VNKVLGFTKQREFLEWLSDCWFLRKDCDVWSKLRDTSSDTRDRCVAHHKHSCTLYFILSSVTFFSLCFDEKLNVGIYSYMTLCATFRFRSTFVRCRQYVIMLTDPFSLSDKLFTVRSWLYSYQTAVEVPLA